MKFIVNVATLAVVTSLVLAATAAAQFETNGPNAAYRVNGNVPSSVSATHDVQFAVPGFLDHTIETAANPHAGVIFCLSTTDPSGVAVANVPGLGIWNLGVTGVPLPLNVVIMGDGIGFSVNPITDNFYRSDNGNPVLGTLPTFRLGFNVGVAFCGQRIAFQAIVQDPFALPFGLDITECADVHFAQGQQTIAMTGDDGTVPVPFSPGNSFNFHGVNYTEVYLCGNGFMSFGGFNNVNAAGFTVDVQSWLNDLPSIAICMSDWSPGWFSFTDGVEVNEAGTSVQIVYGGPSTSMGGINHFADNDSNRFQAHLILDNDGSNPCITPDPTEGTFTLSYPFLDPNTTNRPGDGVMGHTPGGMALAGGSYDRDLHSTQLPNPNEAQLEEHNRTGFNQTTVGWDGLGTPRLLNEFRHWAGDSVTFIPTGAPTGSAGYLVVGHAPTTDAVSKLDVTSVGNAGGETVTALGKFGGFGAGGSVIFDPNGTAGFGPAFATITGVLDGEFGLPLALPNDPNTGPYRNAEGLVFVTPSMGSYTGSVQVEFNFDSGTVRTLNVIAANPGTVITSYANLGADDFTQHTLSSNTISFYGVNYTQFYLTTKGYIAFQSNFLNWDAQPATLFNGIGTNGNQAVAIAYTDLNPSATHVYNVIEDTLGGSTTIQFTNQQFWNSGLPAGEFAMTFDAAAGITFDHGLLLPGAPFDQICVGWSNADGNGANNVLGISLGYVSSGPGESIAEAFTMGSLPPVQSFNGNGIWTALDIGNDGTWFIF